MTAIVIPSGLDLGYRDSAVRPQDDLFGHVNGRWLTDYQMPPDRATDGAFRSLFDQAEIQVRDLIADASRSGGAVGTDEQRIGDLYASFLDEQAVEHRGLEPLLDELALIDGAADRDALAATLG
ncbi:MAG TPA: peptidase M13, partial [Mycobacterium sp.]|nr:peptidase M13 [Mycobacterium sp.]